MQTASPSFVRSVRNALTHLCDGAYLQNHPLANLLDDAGSFDVVSRAQSLRRLLLSCIDELKPQGQTDLLPDSARAHAILTYHFVDGMTIDEIAERRGLSQRQAYRELETGVNAVASLLLDRLSKRSGFSPLASWPSASGPPASAPPAGALQAAQAEVARLRSNVHAESLDARDVLQSVCNLLAPLCDRVGVRAVIGPPNPWNPVTADRVLLRQALLSLLTDALHVASPGDLAIEAAARRDSLLITFQSAAASAPSPVERPEIRLSVAHALIEAQGGRLETDHAHGCWRAQLQLPAGELQAILVIDDNQDIIALLRRYLAGHALAVVGASQGEEALRLATELQPRLITLDVMMPSRDGWEILQQLKQSPATRAIPVVICSVLYEPELAQVMGASDYLTKPVSQEDFLKLLRRLLGPIRPLE
jgi:CheY-like chemotaxis protein